MPRLNPTSSIRGGLDYQDLWGLRLCGEWLKNPGAYTWIWFETVPEEASARRFHLDDIVVLDSHNLYHLYQLKHKQHPNEPWTWDDLLDAKDGSSSLLQKWSRSIAREDIRKKLGQAAFITNGVAADGISEFLSNGRVQLGPLRAQDQRTYDRIIAQFEIHQEAQDFFSAFTFRFGEKSVEDLELEVWDDFRKGLLATDAGINSLYLQIGKECRKRITEPLGLDQIREWCEFDRPRPLREDFHIPTDFQVFDNEQHRSILEDIKKPGGGVIVIVGKPGAGKSVYLSKLYELAKQQGIIAIRHHSHLSPEDPNPQERLVTDRVLEAIKAQFKEHPNQLGSLANKNSRDIEPREFLNAAASSLHRDNRALVMILDGLDHVVRNRDDEELKKFLQSVCFPQPGLWIILGMQMAAADCLPRVVHEKAPVDSWIQMPGLSRSAVEAIVVQNLEGLNLPQSGIGLEQVLGELFDATEGNPLHLRYVLRELALRHNDRFITEFTIRAIVPYSGDIEKYYEALWGQLSDKAKTILFTLASVNFSFKKHQLIECVSQFERKPADVSQAFRAVEHLVEEDVRHRLSVYHNSFQVFLLSQPEFAAQSPALKGHIRDWLLKCSYDGLKWAELRKIQYELGDPQPLLEINRMWLSQAIADARNTYQIDSQLRLAAEAAFKRRDFAKALELSHLQTYYDNVADSAEEAYDRITSEAVRLDPPGMQDIEPRYVVTPTLVTLAEVADTLGQPLLVEEVIATLIERQDEHDYHHTAYGAAPSLTRALLETLPYDPNRTVTQLFNYIKQFAGEDGLTPELFGVYARTLLKLGQIDNVSTLLRSELLRDERDTVMSECARHNALQGREVFDLPDGETARLVLMYRALSGSLDGDRPPLPAYRMLPNKLEDFDKKAISQWRKLCVESFAIGLIYGLTNGKNHVDQWISEVPNAWSAKALAAIFKATETISTSIRASSQIACEDLFRPLQDLERLEWPGNRDRYGLREGFVKALSDILSELFTMRECLDDTRAIDDDAMEMIVGTPFHTRGNLLDLLANSDKPVLSHAAYESLLAERREKLEQSVTDFPIRAAAYAKLVTLCRIHGDIAHAKEMLARATDNLLGYGYHKDMYLHGVMEAIDACGRGGTARSQIDTWLNRVSPLAEAASDYTDGDETRHFRFDLARLLARYDRSQLYMNYFAHADKEDLFHAQALFKIVISSLSFESDEETALGTTALDRDSLEELKRQAETKHGASQALETIAEHLGVIDYPPESSPSEHYPSKTESDFASVPPLQLTVAVENSEFESPMAINNFLEGWVLHWIEKGDRKHVFEAVRGVVEERVRVHSYVSGALLDLLCVLALEVERELAFDYLCRAQANDHGWQMYWTDKSKAERRWQFLKANFPARYLEFFERSIAYESEDRRSPRYFVPVSRGIEFLVLFGDLQTAEVITEAAITFSESLMAGSQLPCPLWKTSTYADRTVDEVGLLIQRLCWPSPLVRERAATGLSRLLALANKRQECYASLLSWMNGQVMESVVTNGLLVFIRAFELHNRADLAFIRFEQIVAALHVNSVAIEKLLGELASAMQVGAPVVPATEYTVVAACPDAYAPDEFFHKYVGSFLAPVYFERAQDIERSGGYDFIRTWAFVADQLIASQRIERNSDVGYFHGRTKESTLMGMSTKLSEAYRSAFLRVVQKYRADGLLNEDFYLQYALATIPVDLSLWKIRPKRAPGWWPRLKNDAKMSSKFVQLACEEPIEALQSQGDDHVLVARGAVKPAAGWNSATLSYSFSLTGFAYRVVGPHLPTAEQVARQVIDKPAGIVLMPSLAERPLRVLENNEGVRGIGDGARRVGDMIIYPLVAQVIDLTISLWQFFRDYDSFSLLAPVLHERLTGALKDDEYAYESDGVKVATVSDWLEGLRERNDPDLPLPHGQWVQIAKSFLDPFLADRGLRLGHLLRTSYGHRPHIYDEVEAFDQYQLLGVSGIVLP